MPVAPSAIIVIGPSLTSPVLANRGLLPMVVVTGVTVVVAVEVVVAAVVTVMVVIKATKVMATVATIGLKAKNSGEVLLRFIKCIEFVKPKLSKNIVHIVLKKFVVLSVCANTLGAFMKKYLVKNVAYLFIQNT